MKFDQFQTSSNNFQQASVCTGLKYLFTGRDDSFKSLAETNNLGSETFTSGVRPWGKSVACLSSLVANNNGRSKSTVMPGFRTHLSSDPKACTQEVHGCPSVQRT